MKKYLFTSVCLFMIFISNVYAYDMESRFCIYRDSASHSVGTAPEDKWRNYLEIDYTGIGDGFSKYDNGTKKTIFSYEAADSESHYVNWRTPIPGMEIPYLYYTEAIISQKMNEIDPNEDIELICPEKIYIMEYTIETGKWNPFVANEIKTTYDLYACGNNYGDYNVDTCPETWNLLLENRKTANHDGTAGKLHTLEYYTDTYVDNKDIVDKVGSNVQYQYNDTQEKIDDVCDKESDAYDEEECNKLNLQQDALISQGEAEGISEETLYENYQQLKAETNLDFDADVDCSSYLGYVGTKGTPAYYLDFVFQIMKYIAIVLLFVLTVVDFAKATASNKDDAIKKALQTAVKRTIIAVIIFFLPILVNFILDLLGVVSTNPTCGIK